MRIFVGEFRKHMQKFGRGNEQYFEISMFREIDILPHLDVQKLPKLAKFLS